MKEIRRFSMNDLLNNNMIIHNINHDYQQDVKNHTYAFRRQSFGLLVNKEIKTIKVRYFA